MTENEILEMINELEDEQAEIDKECEHRMRTDEESKREEEIHAEWYFLCELNKNLGTKKSVREIIDDAKENNKQFCLCWVWRCVCSECGKQGFREDEEYTFEGTYEEYINNMVKQGYSQWEDNADEMVELFEYDEEISSYNSMPMDSPLPMYRYVVDDNNEYLCEACRNE